MVTSRYAVHVGCNMWHILAWIICNSWERFYSAYCISGNKNVDTVVLRYSGTYNDNYIFMVKMFIMINSYRLVVKCAGPW